MKVETKINKLIKLKEDILKDAKKWKHGTCPLDITGSDYRLTHYNMSQLFNGLGCWKWECPFCKKEFTD